MKAITDKNFKEFTEKRDGRVKAVKIGASWCPPCKAMDSALPEIERETPKIDWGKCDMSDIPEMVKELNIASVPMILFYRNGKKLSGKVDGFISRKEHLAEGTKDLLKTIKRIIK